MVFDFQVMYSLQRPVLWLGVRRSLQTGGWQHEVSKYKDNNNKALNVWRLFIYTEGYSRWAAVVQFHLFAIFE